MNYVSWAIFCEGNTDAEYLSVIIPRLIEDIILDINGPVGQIPEQPVAIFGLRNRNFESASDHICTQADAIRLLFVHGDTGGTSIEETLATRVCQLCEKIHHKCSFPLTRCIPVTPRHETEAWCLADKDALRTALGLAETYNFDGLPEKPKLIENHPDPKQLANSIVGALLSPRRRKSISLPHSSIAQSQKLSILRTMPSFALFESRLKKALGGLGYPALLGTD